MPTIISGNNLIIFDPHQKYFVEHGCKRGIRLAFNEPHVQKNYFDKYPNQFAPYLNLNFGSERIDLKHEFKGSFFRFPIRNKEAAAESNISQEEKSIDKIIHEDILQAFYKDFHLILLFLRRLERIEIYEIKDQSTKLIASTFIDYSKSSPGLEQERKAYMSNLISRTDPVTKRMNPDAFTHEDLVNNYKMVIETIVFDRKTIDRYLISSCVKFCSASADLQALAFKTATFPGCSTAYRIHDNPEKIKKRRLSPTGRYFCFLPMPETIEPCGLPFHINGSFGLRDDRRDFKWLAEDTKEDEAAQWNELMVKEVLNHVLVQMLNYSKTLIDRLDSDLSIEEFYSLLPHLENISHHWRSKHLRSYFTSLNHIDLVLTQNNKWINIEHAQLGNKIENDLQIYMGKNGLQWNELHELRVLINTLFDLDKLAKISLPPHVIQIYEQLSKTKLCFIDLMQICDRLREMPSLLANKNDNQKVCLLNFLLQTAEDLGVLKNICLLPMNEKWKMFDSSDVETIRYFRFPHEKQLFSHKIMNSVVFDDSKLNHVSKKRLIDWLEENLKLEQLSMFEKHEFMSLIANCLKKVDQMNQTDLLQWLSLVWTFIINNFNDSLNLFEEYSLIPRLYHSTVQLLPLRDPKGFKYYFCSSKHLETDLSPAVIEFFKEHMVLFDRLPFYELPGSELLLDYFSCFNLENLPEALLVLKKSIGELKFFNLIKNIMNSECKRQLFKDLNTNKSKLYQNKVFVELLVHQMPIFSLYNNPSVFKTINECNRYEPPVLVMQENIQVNPNIDLIDSTGYCEVLKSAVQLKTYPLDKLLDSTWDYYLKNSDCHRIRELLEWLLKNLNKLKPLMPGVDYIRKLFIEKNIFQNNSGQYVLLGTLYDPNDKYVQKFVDKRFHLPEDFNREPFYSCMKAYLLNDNHIRIEHFQDYMASLEKELLHLELQSASEHIKFVVQFLFDRQAKAEFIEATFNYKWLPVVTHDNKTLFHQSHSLFSHSLIDFIGLVEPVLGLDDSIIPYRYYSKLKIKTTASTSKIFSNYCFMLKNKMPIEINRLDKIYSHLKEDTAHFDLETNLIEHFGTVNVPFIFDGVNSYRGAKELVLNSSELNLQPYLHILDKKNKFVNKFESLYLDKFRVHPEVSVEILLDVLNDLKADRISVDEINKLNSIRSIYLLLERLGNVNQLKENLWIPVKESQYTSFERVDNCVYLMEGDEQKELLEDNQNYKICDNSLISFKLLKSLGVKSLTDKVMKIQSLLMMKNYGQHEKITDRIKGLLKGYIDGYSVFKETIQNADDANASVVKFCYDKRDMRDWKNPGKLLDAGMASAPGESLWIYNDGLFSEKDFENLSQLGSGSKQNDADKIGKFGLGFNTVYNLTDLPSIVSGRPQSYKNEFHLAPILF